jgi:hypothetical protein
VAKAIEDILAEMRANPTGVRFADACKVVTHYFGEPRQSGTSHKVWKMPWPGDPRVNMQEGESGKAKAYQVRQAIAAIDALLARREAAAPAPPRPAVERHPRPKKRPRR